MCQLLGENPAVYFTDGAEHGAYDRQAVRDAAATVIYEEKQQAAERQKAKNQQ